MKFTLLRMLAPNTEGTPPGAPGGAAPPPPAVNFGDLADSFIGERYANEPFARVQMAKRYALATAKSANDVPQALAQFFGAASAPTTPTAVAAPVPPPIAPSNTGPPAASPTTSSLPDNPLHWPEDVLSKLTPAEYHEAIDQWRERTGQGNPLAAMRRRVEAARRR